MPPKKAAKNPNPIKKQKKPIKTMNTSNPSNADLDAQIRANPFLKPTSKDAYINSMTAIRRLTKQADTFAVLLDPDAHAKAINTQTQSAHTRQTYFNAVLRYLDLIPAESKCEPQEQPVSKKTANTQCKPGTVILANPQITPQIRDQWLNHYREAANAIKLHEAQNLPTQRQAQADVPWPDIIKRRDELAAADPKTQHGEAHLLLSMYTYIPPRRQLDYANMRVYTDRAASIEPKRDHNWIQLEKNKATMYIHDYKTAKYYSGYSQDNLPPPLIDIIRESLKVKPRDYLFAQADGTPFKNANSFQKYSNRILKSIFNNQHVTVNTLRHSFSTYENTKPDVTIGQRQENAKAMGHSLVRNLQYALLTPPTANTTATNATTPTSTDKAKAKVVASGSKQQSLKERLALIRQQQTNKTTTTNQSNQPLSEALKAKLARIKAMTSAKTNKDSASK